MRKSTTVPKKPSEANDSKVHRPGTRQERCLANSVFEASDGCQLDENELLVDVKIQQDIPNRVARNGLQYSHLDSNAEQSLQSSRHYFIRKGRERLERKREFSQRDGVSDNNRRLNCTIGLTQDDGSYRDELRRSVLEEDYETDNSMGELNNQGTEELQQVLNLSFEATTNDDIISSTSVLVSHSINESTGARNVNCTPTDPEVGVVGDSNTGRVSYPVSDELANSRLRFATASTVKKKRSASPVFEVDREAIDSKVNSAQPMLQLSSEDDSTTTPVRDSPPPDNKGMFGDDEGIPPLPLASMRGREDIDENGGSRPVVRTKRPFLSFPPESTEASEPKQAQNETMPSTSTESPDDLRRRTQERLQYLKKWLREREIMSQTPPTAQFRPAANAATSPAEVPVLEPTCSLHSAPSLDEGECHISQIGIYLKNPIVAAKPACNEGSRKDMSMKLKGVYVGQSEYIIGACKPQTSLKMQDKIAMVTSMEYLRQGGDDVHMNVGLAEQESRDDSTSVLRSLACPDSISERSSCSIGDGNIDDHRFLLSSGQMNPDNDKHDADHGTSREMHSRNVEETGETKDQPRRNITTSSLTDFVPNDQIDYSVSHTQTPQHQSSPLAFKVLASTPRFRKSSRALATPDGEDSIDLSVTYSKANNFESRAARQAGDVASELPIWRMDPLESLSDFIIQIRSKDNGDISTYHVHKHILACGPRRSNHLHRLFQSTVQSSAHFFLDAKGAEVFPCILDFLYCQEYELLLTTSNAVAYRNISEKFEIDSLLFITTRFIHEDMQISNLTAYFNEICAHKDCKLRKLFQTKCATYVEHISVQDPLWILMDPDLFLGTISCPLIDRAKTSPYLSILVKEYASLHMHEMSEATFAKLTSTSVLPTIDRTAALPLLEICFSYGSPTTFERLQERCAYAMASYWKITSENDRQRFFALLRNLPSTFTVNFLEKVETGKVSSLVKTASTALSEDDSSIPSVFSLGSIYNDLKGYDDIALDSESPIDSWRMDSISSYSDWCIRVKHANYGTIDVYDVHKHVIAVGRYKSLFFSDIFLSRDSILSSKGNTTVALDHAAADAFPAMLNFMYSRGHILQVSTETAVAIRFLARVFKVWPLNNKIIDFIESDISIANALTYIEDADSFNDEVVVEMSIQFCATNISEIDVDCQILESLKPVFFGRIVSSPALDPSALATCHVATLAAKYFVLHQLEESLLESLLQEYNLDGLDCLNALKLLQVMSTLNSKDSEFFAQLRKCCVEKLTQNWDDLRDSFRSELFAIFLTLDTETVTHIFDKVEKHSYDTIRITATEHSKLLQLHKSQLVDVKDGHEAEVTKVKKKMLKRFATIAARKEDLEKELQEKEDANAILTSKNIPIVIGAVSSLSEDTNLDKATGTGKGWPFFSCSPGIAT
eukprot:scaffold818_cov136-Cylindrotheca_fusiformis.AAC.6